MRPGLRAFFVAAGDEYHSAHWILEARKRRGTSAAVILFKACPRCGGDIDATYPDDSYCIQCSHRPQVANKGPKPVPKIYNSPGSQAVAPGPEGPGVRPKRETAAAAAPAITSPCPRCASTDLIGLDKLRRQDNTCYRCRGCGHIFSPATDMGERQRITS